VIAYPSYAYDEPDEPAEPAPVNGIPHRGQLRLAYRLADKYAGRLLYAPKIGWHVWDGKRWAQDEKGAAHRAVIATLRKALADSLGDTDLRDDVRRCESAAGIKGVLDIASNLEAFVCAATDLDADPYLLNCANGTLDLRTLALRPHDPVDRITKVTRGAYRPDEAGSGAWPAFLAQILPDPDVREFLQRVVGVALLGKVIEHILPILTGTGANGKGVTYGTVLHALGDYASPAEPELFTAKEGSAGTAAGQMDLRGRRLVVVSESDKDRRLAEATMKRLIGGDLVKAKYMAQNWVTFTPSHTAILVTNFLPKVSGDDDAIWRRMRVIPFEVVVPEGERDPHLGERLELEADAVLAWAVTGYAGYAARGHRLAEPESVLIATKAYRTDSDAVARFLDECCYLNPNVRATTGDLHAAWAHWAITDGAEPLSQKAFGQALDRRGLEAGPAVNGKRWRKGIELLANEDDGSRF
jgi:putative DNA primase/helicase